MKHLESESFKIKNLVFHDFFFNYNCLSIRYPNINHCTYINLNLRKLIINPKSKLSTRGIVLEELINYCLLHSTFNLINYF